MEFFILDVESARRSDCLLWWKPGGCGYTMRLEQAGRYTREQVFDDAAGFNNGVQTLAVPCGLAEALSFRAVPGGSTMLQRLRELLEAAGASAPKPKA